ncbi:ABC transporter ATP-binding protein [Lactobacillus helveticus]|uniref:Putative ABC transporter ATP-binding protein YbhF n=1 Tax=Lactobacillus helveticus TaxID=1587 RepID=A0A3Q8SRQ7_LACHE|nr:ATP-binding cassette domain-containing protein [Lactobacillus helveticus]AFR21548.1 ABC transport protein ATP-binding component [Lactobacillus helveticus R0052]AZK92271.1 putative ABC transporter ATP-binding protein YbhF [Lactobacillus helveticus]MCJ2190740.1 ATP-binding cassette domain-containing protein [Lactobacillus helveticus]MED7628758.1 ATP-binding cassette domain-containing protein [Lactobacillus helveticus]MZR06298.1 ATP-binding cassette domain-containing protein [Lactobacillus hel
MKRQQIIQVQDLTKKYLINLHENGIGQRIKNLFHPKVKDLIAVNSISFSVYEGESVGFIGQNGAGKTTTIKMLTGTLYPSSGYCRVSGFNPSDQSNDFKRSIAVVMGNKSQLFPDLTPRDYLNLLKVIYEIDDSVFDKTLTRVSHMLNIEDKLDIQTRKLSLGERMKMEFLAGIIIQPKILFLDEPTIGLDVISKRDIRNFLIDLNKQENITIFLTSHDMEDIITVCDRLLIMDKGDLIWNGSTQELINKFKGVKYISFTKEELFDKKKLIYEIVKETDTTITIKVPNNKLESEITRLSKERQGTNYKINELKIEDTRGAS